MKLTRYTAEFYLPSDVDSSTVLERLQVLARECCEDSPELTDLGNEIDEHDEDGNTILSGAYEVDEIMQVVEDHCSITDTQVAKDHAEIGRL